MESNKFISGKEACKILGVYYRTLYNWEKKNKIEVIRSPGGKRYYNVNKYLEQLNKVKEISEKIEHKNKNKICYCRVSSINQKDDLERQILYMKEKYPNHKIIKDIGSGLNFKRKGLLTIINMAINDEIDEVCIAYKDRLCRFGYDLIEYIIKEYSNGKIIINNKLDQTPEEELTRDLLQIMNVFNAKINGMRKYKKLKTI